MPMAFFSVIVSALAPGYGDGKKLPRAPLAQPQRIRRTIPRSSECVRLKRLSSDCRSIKSALYRRALGQLGFAALEVATYASHWEKVSETRLPVLDRRAFQLKGKRRPLAKTGSPKAVRLTCKLPLRRRRGSCRERRSL